MPVIKLIYANFLNLIKNKKKINKIKHWIKQIFDFYLPSFYFFLFFIRHKNSKSFFLFLFFLHIEQNNVCLLVLLFCAEGRKNL